MCLVCRESLVAARVVVSSLWLSCSRGILSCAELQWKSVALLRIEVKHACRCRNPERVLVADREVMWCWIECQCCMFWPGRSRWSILEPLPRLMPQVGCLDSTSSSLRYYDSNTTAIAIAIAIAAQRIEVNTQQWPSDCQSLEPLALHCVQTVFALPAHFPPHRPTSRSLEKRRSRTHSPI